MTIRVSHVESFASARKSSDGMVMSVIGLRDQMTEPAPTFPKAAISPGAGDLWSSKKRSRARNDSDGDWLRGGMPNDEPMHLYGAPAHVRVAQGSAAPAIGWHLSPLAETSVYGSTHG
jgi:hypothetical protein